MSYGSRKARYREGDQLVSATEGFEGQVVEDDRAIRIETDTLEAAIPKRDFPTCPLSAKIPVSPAVCAQA